MPRKLGGVSARRGKSQPKLYRGCTRCGGKLPCLRCARAERKQQGLVGKEPTADECDSGELAPEISLAVQRIQEQGFTGPSGRVYPPWSDEDYYGHAGVNQTPFDFAQSSARESRSGDFVNL